jgi:hypothetical protein
LEQSRTLGTKPHLQFLYESYKPECNNKYLKKIKGIMAGLRTIQMHRIW